MKFMTVSALALASLVSVAAAQEAPSGEYALDPAHTTVVFSVSHAGFSLYRGTFSGVEGALTWDEKNPTKSALTVTVDANSVVSPKAVSHAGNDNFQEDIAKRALGSETTPEITFTTTRLVKSSDTDGTIYGDLTMNGTTKPVEMAVNLRKAGEFFGTPRLGFTGETMIDRTEWGSTSWIDNGIGKDVTITVEAEFYAAGE